MRILISALLLGSALLLFVNFQGGGERIFPADHPAGQEISGDEIRQTSASVAPTEGVAPVAEPNAPGEKMDSAQEKVLAARSLYFPHAPEVSRVEIPRGEESEVRRIVKTELAEPYVEIRERYQQKNGQAVIVAQEAMVANQVLLPKPSEGVSEASAKLYSLGAVKVQEKGASLLVTFRGDPNDPLALEGFLAKVKSAFPEVAAIEPNYIRKLFSVE
jgi:hypothetical protein